MSIEISHLLIEISRRELPEQTKRISEKLITALARKFAEVESQDFDAALGGFLHAVEIASTQVKSHNLSNKTDTVLSEVYRLNASGHLEDAAQAINAAIEAEVAEAERRSAEIDKLILTGIDQAILMRDVEQAAALVVRQVDRETPDPSRRFTALRKAHDKWYERGRDQGLSFDLELSIAIAQTCVDRVNGAPDRGTALSALAISLQTLGARENGTARLEKAVATYRALLEEWTQNRVPLSWAMTQLSLGDVLLALGERDSGTARLEEAVAAYRAALVEITRELSPLLWAKTLSNMGIALFALGDRESGTARLEDAVAACRAALEEHTRERVPLDWAMTQNNLGNALKTLGERESGTVRLEEAVAAYRAALEERTRERVPLDWAATTLNLGLVFEALFDKTEERAQLEKAIALVRASREVWDEAGASYYIEKSEGILADMQAKL